MPAANNTLSITQLRVISPITRKNFSNHSALSLLCPHGTGTGERGGQDPPSTAQTWREPPVLMAVIGTPWTCLTCFSKDIVLWVVGAILSHVPHSCGRLQRGFELLSVMAPWWDSVRSWTGTSLQEGLASPAVAPMGCHVLIGTAENLALQLRHALLSLWISTVISRP